MLVLSGLGVLAGCSLTQVDRDDCSTSDECREAFGMGYVCASDGLCDRAEIPARVVLTYPDDLLDNPAAHGDRVILGVIVDNRVETHRMRADSVLMAAEGANDPSTPGIVFADGSNREIAVIVTTNEDDYGGDGLGQDEASALLATQLADRYGVRSVIGPPSSSSTEAAFLALGDRSDDDRPAIISMSATSNSLTDLEDAVEGAGFVPDDTTPGLLWRTAPPDAAQAARILQSLDSMTGRGIAQLAVVYEDGPYGEGLATAVRDGFVAAGGTVLAFEVFTSALTRSDALGAAGSTGAEEVLFVSSQTSDSAAAIVFANTSTDYNGMGVVPAKSLLLTDSAANTDLLVGSASHTAYYPQVRGTRPSAPSGLVYNTFAGSFNGRRDPMTEGTADDYTFIAHAYDAAWMAIYGAAWALIQEDSFNGRRVARGLRKLSDPAIHTVDVRTTTWPTINGWILAGESFDITGASGDLDYDPNTEETTGVVEGWCLETVPESAIVACDIDTP